MFATMAIDKISIVCYTSPQIEGPACLGVAPLDLRVLEYPKRHAATAA